MSKIDEENKRRKDDDTNKSITRELISRYGEKGNFRVFGNKFEQIIKILIDSGYNPNDLDIAEANYFVEEIVCSKIKKSILEINSMLKDENQLSKEDGTYDNVLNMVYSPSLGVVYAITYEEYERQREAEKQEAKRHKRR